MKIILISPYSEKAVGGINTWTKYIVNYQREHGGEVDMLLINNENSSQVTGGTKLLKRLRAGINNYIPVCRVFYKTLEKQHYDVVHICSSASLGLIRDLLVVKAAKKKSIKTCVHMHFGRIPQLLNSSGWEKFLLLRLFKRVDRIVVMDMASYNALKETGYNKMVYLPNPLSSEVQQLIQKNGNLKREPRKIVFAGHVGEGKGVFELVKACSQICQIKLELLGKHATPDIKDKLIEAVGVKSMDWLNIPGNKPFDEVIKEMMTCTVFVLPSYSEGFPNVILESMACGCPIVATPVGAIPEMLAIESDKPCGICLPVKEVDALRNAIVSIIENPRIAEELGKNAKERVNMQYAMPKVWEQLVGIWKEVASI